MLKKNIIILLLSTNSLIVVANNHPSPTNIINSTPKTTIKAGSHTTEENLYHQQFCAKQGGVDITDKSDFQVGTGTIDVIACKITNLHKLKEYENNTSVINNNTIKHSWHMNLMAPNGVRPQGNYNIIGRVDYYDIPGGEGFIEVGVPADQCSASTRKRWEGVIGREIIHTICRGSTSNIAHTYTKGCYDGTCIQKNGVIRFR